MPILSHTDLQILQTGASSLTGSALTEVSVGGASLALLFTNGSSLILQCPFEAYDSKSTNVGHGEQPVTSVALFPFLGKHVSDVSVDEYGKLTLEFGSGSGVRIKSSGTGYESYVLNAAGKVYPVY